MDWSRLTGDDEREEPLCILFANTIGNRLGPSPNEGLPSIGALNAWLARQGLGPNSAPEISIFQPGSLQNPDSRIQDSALVIARAVALREDIFSLLSGGKEGRAFSTELHGALGRMRLSHVFEWELDEEDLLERALMLIAISAADLLSSPLRERVKVCEDAACGWLFLDRSKNHSRRWCSMSDCGNLAKAKRLRARRKETMV